VTNLQFSQFVRSTGYQTDSEKFQWSFVFEALLQEAGLEGIIAQTDDPEHGMGRVKTSLHWLGVHGANWFHPLGQHVVYPTKPSKRATEAAQKEAKGETVKPVYAKKGQKQLERERGEAEAANDRLSVDALGLWDRPVVHVSHNDAVAYCTWSNSVDQDAAEVTVDGGGGGASRGKRRLPTEREWEFAARGGLHNQSYPWGDGSVFVPGQMNVWETDAAYASHTKSPGDLLKGKMGGAGPDGGLAIEFPAIESNTRADGHLGVAPAQSFPANAYGLYNMLGNVWEWVAGGNEKEVSSSCCFQLNGAVPDLRRCVCLCGCCSVCFAAARSLTLWTGHSITLCSPARARPTVPTRVPAMWVSAVPGRSAVTRSRRGAQTAIYKGETRRSKRIF
jgi:formylglycine-generating enzyme required for sulfatase activity